MITYFGGVVDSSHPVGAEFFGEDAGSVDSCIFAGVIGVAVFTGLSTF